MTQQQPPQQPPRGAPAQPGTQALVQTGSGPLAVVKWGMTTDQVELLKRTVAKGTTDDEFALFMTVASRLGLDPFLKQIHAVKRRNRDDDDRETMTIQIGIDGYRLGAARTQEDDGQEGPYWCGADKVWHDVWISDTEPPVAAKVLVYRKGRARPYTGIALWASYVQTKKDGAPNSMWRKHGPGQLAKCAEALAIRKAFPAELAGTHTDDELGADAIDAEFTELRPLPLASPTVSSAAAGPAVAGATHSSPSASQAGPAAAPTSSSKPMGPPPGVPHAPAAPTPLTEDEIVELIEELSRCGTKAALTVWRKQRCEPALARATDAQRERLAKAAEGQLAEIELAKAGA